MTVNSQRIRLALVQLNTRVGHVDYNVQRMITAIEESVRAGANLIVFPEMTLAGYPPEDLLFRASFLARMEEAARALESYSHHAMIIFGYARGQDVLHNVAAILAGGQRLATIAKMELPNYGVFDERRYFRPGNKTAVIGFSGFRIGVSVCEDLWYPDGPYLAQARAGANLLINISASPYARDKAAARERMLCTRAEDTASFLVWNNLVGAQDELVFDGQSVVVGPDGQLIARARAFEEQTLYVELNPQLSAHRRFLDPRWREKPSPMAVEDVLAPELSEPKVAGSTLAVETARVFSTAVVAPAPEPIAQLYQALVVGIRDYVEKTGFSEVVLGLSGGIDSALTAALAVRALGPQRVHSVFMPSPITSTESRRDAYAVAKNLGIAVDDLPIAAPMDAYLEILAPHFKGRPRDLTEENLQARIRGMLLMALSNKLNWLVLTTGNKSEMATGYSTLYGDMAGGFAVLKDVLKTDVFGLARWLNEQAQAGGDGGASTELIPEAILIKPPSAELRPDQRDEDSLPPYDILDQILRGYIEEDETESELIARGLPVAAVELAVRLVDHNEYKRRQAPIGIKVTPRAFGRDRRMPVSAYWD